MKKLTILLIAMLALPTVFAISAGSGIGIEIIPEEFKPQIWLCDSRAVMDDAIESGRSTDSGQPLLERIENYVFEGEQITWTVLVMDKNKIEEVEEVFVSIGPYNDARRMVPYTYFDQNCLNDCSYDYTMCEATCDTTCGGPTNTSCYDPCMDICNDEKTSCDASCERSGMRLDQNDIEVECSEIPPIGTSGFIPAECNARLGEERLTEFDDDTMDFYECTLTVETPDSMYGEYWVTIEVEGADGQYNYADEVEYWFMNPTIALTVDGDLTFEDVLPGSVAYSTSLLVGNDADEGSGVLLDMFISATDFYDPSSSGAKCPTSNRLKTSHNDRSAANLGAGIASGATMGRPCDIDTWINNPAMLGNDNQDHLCYFAANGASTFGNPNADAEGYRPIVYADAFTRNFYNDAEIIFNGGLLIGGIPYSRGNELTPGGDIILTFKLGLPEPCVGDFSEGDIYFWGEAI